MNPIDTIETIIDPLGNEVLLPKNLCDLSALDMDISDIYDPPSKVIASPAMILQIADTPNKNYYFRSLGWQNSLLIATKQVDTKWIAYEVFKNPSGQQLEALCSKGNKINFIEYKEC